MEVNVPSPPPEVLCHVVRLYALNAFIGVCDGLGLNRSVHVYQTLTTRLRSQNSYDGGTVSQRSAVVLSWRYANG